MGDLEVGAVVVGAGIAGLAAAIELQSETSEVIVIDASDRPGGALRTDHVAGYVIERGANTFQVKAETLELFRRVELEATLVRAQPESRSRFIFRDGRLEPVPTSPLAFLRTPLLSARGKARLLAEPFIRRGDGTGETVAEFAGRRLGVEVVRHLIGPSLTGVYAGDETQLGAGAVFGGAVALERRYGSIAFGGVLSWRPGRRGGLRGSYSTVEGLGPLARKLAARLAEPPVLKSRVTKIRLDGRHWQISISGPAGDRQFRARRVVLATPAYETATILAGAAGDAASALADIVYAPIVGIPIAVDPRAVRSRIEGFGFLVSRDAGIRLLGALFMSRLFPNRAPEGRELIQCMLGGMRWRDAVDLPDDVVLRELHADLDRILGLRSEPRTLAITRWRQAIPQPDRDHVRRIEGIREAVARLPGIALAGGYLDGIGVASALASGVRAARELVGERSSA